jgi:hypothetical protein
MTALNTRSLGAAVHARQQATRRRQADEEEALRRQSAEKEEIRRRQLAEQEEAVRRGREEEDEARRRRQAELVDAENDAVLRAWKEQEGGATPEDILSGWEGEEEKEEEEELPEEETTVANDAKAGVYLERSLKSDFALDPWIRNGDMAASPCPTTDDDPLMYTEWTSPMDEVSRRLRVWKVLGHGQAPRLECYDPRTLYRSLTVTNRVPPEQFVFVHRDDESRIASLAHALDVSLGLVPLPEARALERKARQDESTQQLLQAEQQQQQQATQALLNAEQLAAAAGDEEEEDEDEELQRAILASQGAV